MKMTTVLESLKALAELPKQNPGVWLAGAEGRLTNS
jgi:hypothetical protein